MTSRLARWALASLVAVAAALPARADTTLLMAAGAGYRKPLMQLIEAFSKVEPIQVQASFGHMKQIETQARQNPDIAILIGDIAFLKPMDLADQFERLGSGKLALVYSQSVKLGDLSDLAGDAVRRFALPDQKRAVYGQAGAQCLQRLNLADRVAAKLVQADTVPQVGNYVALGEVEAGFVNLTEALSLKDRIGGYLLAPASCYDPIEISMAVIRGKAQQPAVQAWNRFIASAPARAILAGYGLD